MNNADNKNTIIGVMGKKGSGKSYLVKKHLARLPRFIVLDTLGEYTQGVIFNVLFEMLIYIARAGDGNFKVVYRPVDGQEKEDIAAFMGCINIVDNYALIIEEADYQCSPYYINEHFERFIKYGRHYGRSLVWVSRNASEVNRLLTRQSDLLITFVQTEPIDLKYLSNYSFSSDPKDLQKYAFAWSGNPEIMQKFKKNLN